MTDKITIDRATVQASIDALEGVWNLIDSESAQKVPYAGAVLDALRAALSAPAEQATEYEYAIALQRAIEHHCHGVSVPPEIAVRCPHHAGLLNATLSAPAEPVPALLYEHEDGRHRVAIGRAGFADGDPKWHRVGPCEVYGATPAEPGELPALPDAEYRFLGKDHYLADQMRAYARLAIAQAPVAQGEPVAWRPCAWIEHHKGGDNLSWERVDHSYAKASPLYAAPPPAVPHGLNLHLDAEAMLEGPPDAPPPTVAQSEPSAWWRERAGEADPYYPWGQKTEETWFRWGIEQPYEPGWHPLYRAPPPAVPQWQAAPTCAGTWFRVWGDRSFFGQITAVLMETIGDIVEWCAEIVSLRAQLYTVTALADGWKAEFARLAGKLATVTAERDELLHLKADIGPLLTDVTSLNVEIDDLTAERDGLRQDALRYRWIREQRGYVTHADPEKLDTAIDAALQPKEPAP